MLRMADGPNLGVQARASQPQHQHPQADHAFSSPFRTETISTGPALRLRFLRVCKFPFNFSELSLSGLPQPQYQASHLTPPRASERANKEEAATVYFHRQLAQNGPGGSAPLGPQRQNTAKAQKPMLRSTTGPQLQLHSSLIPDTRLHYDFSGNSSLIPLRKHQRL
ncbi:hypothetical protein EYF80_021438 [Liparis tanakae]|uniref:Uncharacterized protein n=1 Tax=Liparis tanakae TaxID=230148 RepID=A0A4Z2HSW8_9TELE|nr:hypothetical protein EYF80_021438 [Liparis tanakae]